MVSDDRRAAEETQARLLHALGDAVRNAGKAKPVFRDAQDLLRHLGDLTDAELRLLFWSISGLSIPNASKRAGFSFQRGYQLRESIMRKHPEFKGVIG